MTNRRRPIPWAAAAGLVLALCLIAAPTALAGPFDKGGSGIVALSDAHGVPTMAEIQAKLPTARKLVCKGKAPRARALSPKAAVASAQRYLRTHTKAAARRKFARSADARMPARALRAGAGAMVAGKPTAALTALLRAHQLRPKDPIALIDASAVLTKLQLPNEALALLKAAQRLKAPQAKRMPFGIPAKALIGNNRGYALLAQHKWKAAIKPLKAAVRQAPLLSEANRNLGAAYLCAGKKKQAAQAIFLGARRQGQTKHDLVVETPGSGPERTRLPAPEIFQLDDGQTAYLPNLTYRIAGRQLHDSFLDAQQRAIAAMADAQRTYTNAAMALSTHERTLPRLTRQRTEDIRAAASAVDLDPDIAQLVKQASDRQHEMHAVQLSGTSQGGFDRGVCGRYFMALDAYDSAQRALATARFHRQTALAAQLKSPVAHDAVIAGARYLLAVDYTTLVSEGTTYTSACDPPLVPPAAAEDGTTSDPASRPCAAPGKPTNSVSFNAILFTIQMDCENVNVELSGGKWVKGFISVGKNIRTGEWTVFGGAAVEMPGLGGTKGTVQEGFYITAASDGTPTDLGFRVGAGASAGVGPVSAGRSSSMDFTIAGGLGDLVVSTFGI